MGSPVDLTLGRCSTVSQAVPRNNEYHNDDHLESSLRETAQEYLRTLQEERRKVEGFKRELPLCIQLLDEAIKTAEEKLVHGKDVTQPMALRLSCSSEKEINGNGRMSPESRSPMLEEFMPLKRRERDGHDPSDISSDGEGEDNCSLTKKKNHPAWMAEAQLWNQTTSQSTDVVHDERKMTTDAEARPEHSEQEQSSVTSAQQQRRPTGGAFVPFQLRELQQQQQQPIVVSRPRPRSGGFCADLNLCVQGELSSAPHTLRAASDVEVGSIVDAATTAAVLQTPDALLQSRKDMDSMVGNVDVGGNSSSSTRKARRCWSPELHRRFVTALHQLGGSHIATPKQLRELMKVDGLTNDEVKSHLQKYRLHTARRPSSSSSPRESAPAVAAAGQSSTPQLLVVGGIWIPPQHAAASPAASHPGTHSHSGVSDPSQPTQFCQVSANSLPLDYFAACINNAGTPATTAGPPMQMLLQHHRQPIFESPQPGTSQSQTSPQGPLQVTSQVSGATQGSSSETYESGGEEAKSQSTVSWKFCRRSAVICTT